MHQAKLDACRLSKGKKGLISLTSMVHVHEWCMDVCTVIFRGRGASEMGEDGDLGSRMSNL